MKIRNNLSVLFVAIALGVPYTESHAAQVYSTDVVVKGKECVGTDCVSSETFSFDTLRLKENNVQIHFDDTSSSSGFPANDWRIMINDSEKNGENYFSVEDSTAGKTPFKIEAGASANAMVVDSTGQVGFGTDSPRTSLHTVWGDGPALRLEQDASNGWTPQIWDFVGNESNLFVRDMSHSQKLPFKIKSDSPTNSLYIQPDYVYFGNKVYIKENTSQLEPRLEIQNTNAVNYEAMRLTTPQDSIDIANTSQEFQVNFVNTGISNAPELALDNSGTLTIQGDLVANGVTYTSSRKLKDNFASVDPDEVLNKVDELDVLSWNYSRDPESVRHIGPMAEDFHKQFGLNGEKDGVISASDVNGVALAAIKALKARSDTLERELQQKDEQLDSLRRAVDELKAAVAR